MFLDTESEMSIVRETAFWQLVFFNLQTSFKDFFCLIASDSDVGSNLVTSSDTERSDCVFTLGGNWILVGQILLEVRGRVIVWEIFGNGKNWDKLPSTLYRLSKFYHRLHRLNN